MGSFPKLRPEVTFTPILDSKGRKIIVVYDPVGVKYYRISDYELAFLKKLDGYRNNESVAEELRKEGRHYKPEDCNAILEKASLANLLLGTTSATGEFQHRLKKNTEAAQSLKPLADIFSYYIPLFNPDCFLTRSVWLFRLFYNKWCGVLLIALIPGAIFLIIDGLPRLRTEFLFFFNFNNMLLLGLAIALTKIIHEFSHAYVAKGFGLRVPVLGVGFVMFFPVMYCDTSDSWTLADRNQRIAISAAGIVAEIVMAVVAVYIWYFSQPGMVNSIAFYLMTFSLTSTVLFNGNPLIRFDGYFVLMDLLQQPNLALKALNHVKYLWMNKVLGITRWKTSASSLNERSIFTIYGLTSFVYRFSMVFGIVAAVYYRVDKTLGILLALTSIFLNIGLPLGKGARSLFNNVGSIRPRFLGSIVFLCLLICAVRLVTLPWASNSVYPCYVASAKSQILTAPVLTTVKKSFVKEGSSLKQGEMLFTLDASDLELSLLQKEVEKEALRAEVEMALLARDEKQRAGAGTKAVEVLKIQNEIDKIKLDLDKARDGIRAPFDGVITKLEPKMQDGFRPEPGAVLGELKSVTERVARGLIPEHHIHLVHEDQNVILWFPIKTGIEFRGRIDQVRKFSEADLSETPFPSTVGGEIASEELQDDKSRQIGGGKRLAPLEGQYVASILLDETQPAVPLGMTGRVVLAEAPKSLLSRVYEQTLKTFYRESLF